LGPADVERNIADVPHTWPMPPSMQRAVAAMKRNVVPKLTNHPGALWRSAPRLGEDNDLVDKAFVGKTDEELSELQAGGHA
jgi:hypothetical protein